MILGIDPGPEQSGWVEYDPKTRFIEGGVEPNEDVLVRIEGFKKWMKPDRARSYVAIELMASFGMAVGAEVFETCMWAGEFKHAWRPFAVVGIYRMTVKMLLCNSARAKDANIRQALIDRFGPSRKQAIGVKSHPGPLYSIKKDAWAALAVAVTASESCAVSELAERVRVARS